MRYGPSLYWGIHGPGYGGSLPRPALAQIESADAVLHLLVWGVFATIQCVISPQPLKSRVTPNKAP